MTSFCCQPRRSNSIELPAEGLLRMQQKIFAGLTLVATLASLIALPGCGGGFFLNNTPTTPPVATTGDYVYAVNQITNTLSGFVVGAGTLTPIGTTALTTGLAAASVAVSRPNSYVYVGGNGAITCYSIGSGGALTAVTTSAASATANFIALDTSPDGQWLAALDTITLSIYVYQINTSTGALTLNATTSYAAPGNGIAAPRSLRFAPGGGFLVASLGPGGDVLFSFNTTTGAIVANTANIVIPAGFSDNASLFNATNGYLIVARGGPTSASSALSTYSVSSSGLLATVQNAIASGNAPFALLLDSTGAFAYTANRGDSTVSGYTLSNGTLTALAGSPYASGTAVTALALDNSGKYVIAAAAGGSSDLTLYGFDALNAGKLNALAVAVSGTDPAGSIALATTH